jgi:hypothetical protein
VKPKRDYILFLIPLSAVLIGGLIVAAVVLGLE